MTKNTLRVHDRVFEVNHARSALNAYLRDGKLWWTAKIKTHGVVIGKEVWEPHLYAQTLHFPPPLSGLKGVKLGPAPAFDQECGAGLYVWRHMPTRRNRLVIDRASRASIDLAWSSCGSVGVRGYSDIEIEANVDLPFRETIVYAPSEQAARDQLRVHFGTEVFDSMPIPPGPLFYFLLRDGPGATLTPKAFKMKEKPQRRAPVTGSVKKKSAKRKSAGRKGAR